MSNCSIAGGHRRHRPPLQLLLDINIRAAFQKLDALLVHSFLHFFRDFHRAKLRTTHAAEMRKLRAVLWKRFVVKVLGCGWIETEVELIFPAEFESSLA